MPIRCVCPNGHALRVKDKLAGQQGVCPKCGAGFDVPTLSAAPAAADAGQGPPQQPIPRQPATPAAPPSPPTPAEETAVEWRLALTDGQQFGPTVATVFAQWIQAGRVTPDALVWRTGWPEWRRAAEAAGQLPAPLPGAAPNPAQADPPPLPSGVTLPPTADAAEAPSPATAVPRLVKPTKEAGYAIRRRRQARRRRVFTIVLAVVCLVLAGMLVWVMLSGPPAGAPVLPA